MGMSEEDNVAAVLLCNEFKVLERRPDTEFMSMSSEDLVLDSRKYKMIRTERVIIAVACNMDYPRSEFLMRGHKAVKFGFAVTEVYEPISVGIPYEYTFNGRIAAVGI